MISKFYLNIGVIMLSVMTLTGCKQPDVVESVNNPPKLVKAIVLNQGINSGYRDFPGVVEASEEATLAFRVSGELTQLLVTSGQLVSKNQLLAKLDPTDYQIAVDQAQANYDLAKVQFDRTKKLLDNQLASKAVFDEANAQLQVASAALKSAQSNLDYTELRAPFSGQIAQRFVENFESITAQQPVISLQINNVVNIAIQIPENFLSNVDASKTFEPEVRFDSHREDVFRAKLKEYDTDADPATNTYKVVFQLKRPDSFNVFSGMSASIRAPIDKVTTLKSGGWDIPASAIFNDGTDEQQSYVFVIGDDMVLEQRQVKLGGITDNGFNVVSGLFSEEKIVATGVQFLTAGDTVRIWQKERGL